MTIGILIAILCYPLGSCLAIWLLHDLLLTVYGKGYEQGRREASDWWTQTAKDVEAMQDEIRKEK